MDILSRLFRIARAQATEWLGDTPRPAPASGGGRPDPVEAPWGHPTDRPANVDPRLERYYANLELPYGADLDQVRAAWKRMMRTYHPDLHSRDPEKRQVANELTARLTEAYEELQTALKGNTR